jgi:hypothetical protein
MTFTKARDLVHIDIARSIVTGDVVASDNSVVTITDSGVSGRLIQEGAGRIVTTRVFGLSKGFVLSGGKLTTDPSEVISGRASIKGSFFGSAPFSSILNSDPNVIRLSANQTYRVSFKYRILAAASKEFDVSFLSNKGIAAGYFLPPLTINGKDGDTGTGALTAKLGPYDDYSVSWGLAGTGALVIDDIQFIDVATGQVIASENGESGRGRAGALSRRWRRFDDSPHDVAAVDRGSPGQHSAYCGRRHGRGLGFFCE